MGRQVLNVSTNSIRGLFPGVPSNIARVLMIRSFQEEKGNYLASSTKLLALLGVGDAVLGVNVDVMIASSAFKSIEVYAMFPSLFLQVLFPWSLEGVMLLCVDSAAAEV
jgi:hypothetical protein